MSKRSYPLTLEHVKTFLATKADEDEIGICFNALHCVLSDTLNWLYPEERPWRVDIGTYDAQGVNLYDVVAHNSFRLDEKLDYLRSAFDRASHTSAPITKAMLRRHLEFLAEEQDEIEDIHKMPFALTDLFPESEAPHA